MIWNLQTGIPEKVCAAKLFGERSCDGVSERQLLLRLQIKAAASDTKSAATRSRLSPFEETVQIKEKRLHKI